MGGRGGRKRSNSGKNKLKPIAHSERRKSLSLPIFETVVCLHFQGQEKNLLTCKKGNKKVPE